MAALSITGLTGTDANLRVNRIGFRELRQTVKVGQSGSRA